jgi:hypothetical protein
MTGPIPTPLRPLDYQFIRSSYLRDGATTEALFEAYLFALAFDGSPRAISLLSEVINNFRKRGFKLDEGRYLQVARASKIGETDDLATSVLQRATFLGPADREDTSAKLIAYTAAKDKALVEMFVNRGPLAQEWYHVVVSRCERGWQLFSITQTAQS